MAKKLYYTRGSNGSVLELIGHMGLLEKRLIVPKEGLSESHIFNLGQNCTFVNKSAVPIQIDAYRDFPSDSIIDYEIDKKVSYVAIDTEFSGTVRFTSTLAQSFDSRFLYPENDVVLHGELTLIAMKAASA